MTQILSPLTLEPNVAPSITTNSAISGNVFMYREGETSSSGNIFSTWAEAYAAAIALGIPSTIIIDDSISPCEIPENSGDFDLSNITLSGINFSGTLNIRDGVTWNKGFYKLTNYVNVTLSFNNPGFLITPISDISLIIDNGALVGIGNDGGFVDISTGSNTANLLIDNKSYVNCFFFNCGDGYGNVNLTIGNGTSFGNNIIRSNNPSGANLSISFNTLFINGTPGGFPGLSNFFGNVSVNYGSEATLLKPFTNSGLPSLGTNYDNIVVGTMVYDEITNKPYWWNGTQWIDPSIQTPKQIIHLADPNVRTTDLSAGNHIKFDSWYYSHLYSPPNVTIYGLSNSYTTTLNVNSVGRIRLGVGRFKLTASIPYAIGDGYLIYGWEEVSASPSNLGTRTQIYVPSGGGFTSGNNCVAFIENSGPNDFLIELRIYQNTGFTSIGDASNNLWPWAIVEDI